MIEVIETCSSVWACAHLSNWKSADGRTLRESYYFVEKGMDAHHPNFVEMYYKVLGMIVSAGSFTSLTCKNLLVFV